MGTESVLLFPVRHGPCGPYTAHPVPPPSRRGPRMNSHETPQDRPEPQQAGGAHTERRYARRIDCAERPRAPQHAAHTEPPARPRDDAHP